jgi:short-subunit dehydrogenase
VKNLRGRTAIVTGASRGIGVYIAKRLAREGVNIALVARDAAKLGETRAACDALGSKTTTIAADVGSIDALRRVVDTTEKELGPADILINNAGVEVTASVMDHSLDDVDAVLRTNLSAPIWLTKLVLPGMVARGQGAIVHVSSMAGKSMTPYNAIYSASKHGINAFAASLELELEGTGVHTGVVCPGFVADAGMWADTGEKAPRMMAEVAPERVADAVMAVISGAREELVTPMPVRPLLALQALFPAMGGVTLKRMGVVQAFKSRAERFPRPNRGSEVE